MEPAAPTGRGWRQLIGIATGAGVICIGAGIASASDGGGVGTPAAPALSDVVCVERCAGLRTAAAGSRIELTGRNLSGAEKVAFASAGEERISVAPDAATETRVEARVPEGARSGSVRVSAYGIQAETPPGRELEIVAASEIPESGEFQLTAASATPRETYYDGARRPTVSYVFAGGQATDVRIEVVSRETKETVGRFVAAAAEPNDRNVATWDGRGADGKPAPNGEYKFRIGPASGGTARATRESAFGYHPYRFPLDGRHSYGDGFGAGRDHEGQDVFARCGAPIHAARGGRVQVNDVHPAAGNYLVIDGKGTQLDFMYAHLVRPSPLSEGARVRTGQVIANVGQSGNASGCHLHFELWSAPGWYEGGHALPSVGRLLKTWDSWS
jgi:murein DD-endopeptidase MepM/ murein hydrolase activator NlpD